MVVLQARAEILLTEDAGFLEPEGALERTSPLLHSRLLARDVLQTRTSNSSVRICWRETLENERSPRIPCRGY